MSFAKQLEAGRRDFLEAVDGLSEDHARSKARLKGWSILECIEHVALVEERYVDWLADGRAIEPQRNAEKELRLFTTIRSRFTKLEAAEPVRPAGRHRALAEALARFRAARDASVKLVEQFGDELYAVGVKHPYFGAVNGAELIQLMDGHARRHADQIRELRSELESLPSSRAKVGLRKKVRSSKRDAPDMPAVFEETLNWDFGGLQDAHVRDLERSNVRVDTLRAEGSLLERVHLPGGQVGALVWKDVRLVGCDLANLRAHRISFLRVELIDCRLAGICATAVEWQDVLIQNGDLRYAQLQGGIFRSCEFHGCKWREADLSRADLSGSMFRSCDLAQADLRGSKLLDADFRTSEVEGMLVDMGDLRGAIVDPAQAMVFARVLGLQIR